MVSKINIIRYKFDRMTLVDDFIQENISFHYLISHLINLIEFPNLNDF